MICLVCDRCVRKEAEHTVATNCWKKLDKRADHPWMLDENKPSVQRGVRVNQGRAHYRRRASMIRRFIASTDFASFIFLIPNE